MAQRDSRISTHTDDNSDSVVMDYQVESQRGWFLFGYPSFSSDSLLPFDPKPFTTLDGYTVGYHLEDFQVPNNQWTWTWDSWYVDMSNDVDNQGWIYSWRFGSAHWHGRHLALRSFVRQRRWKRQRAHAGSSTKKICVKVKDIRLLGATGNKYDLTQSEDPSKRLNLLSNASATTLPSQVSQMESFRAAGGVLELLRALEGCRNDRERTDTIATYTNLHPDMVQDIVISLDEIIAKLHFPLSRRQLKEKLEKGGPACKKLAAEIKLKNI